MQSPLISIPQKTTTETDYAAPLRSTISLSYGDDPSNYASEIALLQRTRQDAVKGAGSDATQRDLLYRYFGQLELLELRFPELKVVFNWNDAFTHKLTTQSSLAFEKASIIFLLASTLSSLAASSPRTDPDGLKRAYNYLRSSSGMLVYINENFLHAPSTDLSKEVVKYLVGIISAQAQEVFLEKVESEGRGKGKNGGPVNAGLVSRLAWTTGSIYAALGEEVKEFFGKGIVDRNWVNLMNVKTKHFQSIAQFYRSLHDSAQSKHGDALARLNVADGLSKEAVRLAAVLVGTFTAQSSPTLPSDTATSMVEIVKTHATVVEERKVQAQKENNLIYHAILPAELSLAPIDKFDAAKPIPIQETYATADVAKLIGQDIFHRLVPLAVHEQASVYSEEKAKLVRFEVDRSEEADGDGQASLASLGLPEVLNRYRGMLVGGQGGLEGLAMPGSAVLGWAGEVNQQEREEETQTMLARLDKAKSGVERDLNWIKEELDKESRECEKLRAKYGLAWTQSPSASLTKSYREDFRNQQTAFTSASQSDQRIVALYTSIRPSIATLQAPNALSQTFSQTVDAAGRDGQALNLLDVDVGQEEADEKEKAEMKTLIGEVEERLGRLHRLKKERNDALKELKELIQNDDVSQQLLLNRRTAPNGESSVFAAELEKFTPFKVRVTGTIDHQQKTLEELGQRMDKLGRLHGVGKTMKDWEKAKRAVAELSAKLEGDVGDYREVRRASKRGLDFYEQLQTMTDSLRKTVKSFLSSREEERNRLVSSAERPGSLSSPSPSGSSTTPFVNPYAPANPHAGQQAKSTSPSYPSPSSQFPPPPPPQPASNPYDFSSLGSSLSAYSTALPPPAPAPPSPYGAPPSPYPPSQPAPQQHSAYPPPPSANTSPYPSYPSFQQSTPSPYQAAPAPPAPQSQHYQIPYGSLPPPPPQPQRQGSTPNAYYPSPPAGSPYGAPPSPYPAPPAPPPGGGQYGAPPPANPYSQYSYRG